MVIIGRLGEVICFSVEIYWHDIGLEKSVYSNKLNFIASQLVAPFS